MKTLILGGTQFLGREIVNAALEAGHEVTMFNRGKTNPGLYPDVEKLRGDRDGNLEALKGRNWNAVIDVCGYVPRIVGDSARLLADSVEHYTFISTVSAYAPEIFSTPGTDESFPLRMLEDETIEEVTMETYGGLKGLCEKAAEAALPGRVLIVRPGIIVGPHDPTDRFTYWPVRISRGGEVLAPPPDVPIQVIDVRDISRWIIRLVEQNKVDIYNATGPNYHLTIGMLFKTCQEIVGDGAAQVVMVDDDFLVENEIVPWTQFPLMMLRDRDGIAQIKIDKAIGDGLAFTPLVDTITDTIAWFEENRSVDDGFQIEGAALGLPLEQEAELIAAWKERRQ